MRRVRRNDLSFSFSFGELGIGRLCGGGEFMTLLLGIIALICLAAFSFAMAGIYVGWHDHRNIKQQGLDPKETWKGY